MPVADRDEAIELDVNRSENRDSLVVTDVDRAKAKRARLRLMKERNENYLAERKEYESDEFTQELRVSTAE